MLGMTVKVSDLLKDYHLQKQMITQTNTSSVFNPKFLTQYYYVWTKKKKNSILLCWAHSNTTNSKLFLHVHNIRKDLL